ncbi:MAG: 7-cyano-7-deazaguanine synthase QueC [Bacteroidetes bacterium]|nr:7-cyano-7-deazaguanine synthase QueC [Bacteroidota bacterium]
MKATEVILLLSGGIDSTTLLAELSISGYKIHALSFDYQQRHHIELEFAQANTTKYQVYKHEIIELDIKAIAAHSMLTNQNIPIINYHQTELPKAKNETYVPGRNLLMLSHAAAYAQAHQIKDIYFAANADDGKRFSDCQPIFVAALNQVWQSCENTAGIKVHTPFITWSKAKVIQHSQQLGIDLELTISCYAPIDQNECGTCLSCVLKNEAMKESKSI